MKHVLILTLALCAGVSPASAAAQWDGVETPKARMAQFTYIWERLGADKRLQEANTCIKNICLQFRRADKIGGDIVIAIKALDMNKGSVNHALCFGNKTKQPVPICMGMEEGKMFSLGDLSK